jgi:hypothetical protein
MKAYRDLSPYVLFLKKNGLLERKNRNAFEYFISKNHHPLKKRFLMLKLKEGERIKSVRLKKKQFFKKQRNEAQIVGFPSKERSSLQ